VYTLSKIPDDTCVVRGDLGGRGEGVIGVMSGEGIESELTIRAPRRGDGLGHY